MVKVERFKDLEPYIGKELGSSHQVEITQSMIDRFGEVTGDQHWIHTDPQRARAQAAYGGTVAHGFLTLALVTHLLADCYEVQSAKHWLNYGLDKIRFTAAVLPGQKLQLRVELTSMEAREGGATRLALKLTMQAEGADRPAMVADFLTVGYE
jgi:acyl dehydratase